MRFSRYIGLKKKKGIEKVKEEKKGKKKTCQQGYIADYSFLNVLYYKGSVGGTMVTGTENGTNKLVLNSGIVCCVYFFINSLLFLPIC